MFLVVALISDNGAAVAVLIVRQIVLLNLFCLMIRMNDLVLLQHSHANTCNCRLLDIDHMGGIDWCSLSNVFLMCS